MLFDKFRNIIQLERKTLVGWYNGQGERFTDY